MDWEIAVFVGVLGLFLAYRNHRRTTSSTPEENARTATRLRERSLRTWQVQSAIYAVLALGALLRRWYFVASGLAVVVAICLVMVVHLGRLLDSSRQP
jgi:hypothetical protein